MTPEEQQENPVEFPCPICGQEMADEGRTFTAFIGNDRLASEICQTCYEIGNDITYPEYCLDCGTIMREDEIYCIDEEDDPNNEFEHSPYCENCIGRIMDRVNEYYADGDFPERESGIPKPLKIDPESGFELD
jgi:hypothetical protein